MAIEVKPLLDAEPLPDVEPIKVLPKIKLDPDINSPTDVDPSKPLPKIKPNHDAKPLLDNDPHSTIKVLVIKHPPNNKAPPAITTLPKFIEATFPKFSSLPQQLRLMIWTHTLTPRQISIGHIFDEKRPFARVDSPSLLHVCQESRRVGLEEYSIRLAPALLHSIYFSSYFDTLYFEDYDPLLTVNLRLHPMSPIGKRARVLLVNDMKMVRNIAVGVPFEQEHYYFPAGRSGTAIRRDAKCLTLFTTISCFGNLEKFTFVCGTEQIDELDVEKEELLDDLRKGRYHDEDAKEWDYDIKEVKKMVKMVDIGKVLQADFEG